MDLIQVHVGNRIRLYRKIKNLTIDELAKRINKSKATVSKYETGSILLDIVTLFEIASVLDIHLNQLIDYKYSERDTHKERIVNGNLTDTNEAYLYFYDGREKKIIKNVLNIFSNKVNGAYETTLFMNIESFSNYSNCKHIYFGEMMPFDSVTNFRLVNQYNPIEEISLSVMNSFGNDDIMIGLMSGISNYPIMPVAVKIFLSKSIIDHEDPRLLDLVLSKDEFKEIKRFNMFVATKK
jgi:transcriptional regulator with XRE-family HTH domain